MAFNKLQGLTLLITFFVICLLNAKSYDFAEADQQVFEAVNDLMEGDMTSEAVDQVSKKLFGFLPKMQVLKDPKVLAAIAAALTAIVAGGVVYAKSGKIADWPKHVKEIMDKRMARDIDAKLPDAEKNKIKEARETMQKKISDILDDSDLKKHEEKAEELMKKAYVAQKEYGVKTGELISIFKGIVSNKAIVIDPKVEYTKPLKDGAAKPDVKPSEDSKNFVASIEGDFTTLTTAYTKSLEARKEVEALLKIFALSDTDLITVDMTAKPQDMKKGSKK